MEKLRAVVAHETASVTPQSSDAPIVLFYLFLSPSRRGPDNMRRSTLHRGDRRKPKKQQVQRRRETQRLLAWLLRMWSCSDAGTHAYSIRRFVSSKFISI